MTIQPTSSHIPHAAAQNSTPKPPAPKPPEQQPQDSVELSSKAKASSGDVDHDGDSH